MPLSSIHKVIRKLDHLRFQSPLPPKQLARVRRLLDEAAGEIARERERIEWRAAQVEEAERLYAEKV